MILTNTMLYKGKVINVDYQEVEQVTEYNGQIHVFTRYEIHAITDKNENDILFDFPTPEILKLEKLLKECLSNLIPE